MREGKEGQREGEGKGREGVFWRGRREGEGEEGK